MSTRFKTYFLGLSLLVSVFIFFSGAESAKASDGNFGFNVTYSKASIAWNYIDASTVTITQGEWVNLKLNTIWNLSSGCWQGADVPRCTPEYTIGQANTVVRWSEDSCPAGVSCYWYSRTGPMELTTVVVPNFTYGPSIQISNTNVLSPGTYPIVFKIEEYPTACQQSGGYCIPPKTFTVNLVVQGQPPQPAISAIPTSVSFTAAAGGAAPAGNNITVKNIGNGTLNWTASLNQNWCHLNTTSGTLASGASTSLSVWVDSPSNVGSFLCVVTFSDPNSSNGSQAVNLNYTVTSAPPPPPPSGSGSPILTSINPTQATLSQVQAQMTMDVFGSQFNPVLSNNLPYYTRNADGQTTGISAVSFIPGGIRIYVPANFLAGTYTVQILNAADFMNLRSNGLTFTVVPDAPKAAIVISPANLSFSGISGGATPGSQGLVIRNTGTADLNWTASTNQGWCHISPASGTVSPGGVVTANVSVDAPSNVGSFNCNISVSGPNSTNSPQTASLTYIVTQQTYSSINLSNNSFIFNAVTNGTPSPASQSLNLTNGGTGNLNWTASVSQSWCNLSSTSGTLTPGSTSSLNISVGVAPPTAGSLNCTITFSAPDSINGSKAVSVTYNVSSIVIDPLKPTISLNPATISFSAVSGGQAPASQTLTISNTGTAVLNWSLSTDQNWCHASLSSGTTQSGSTSYVNVTVDSPSNVGGFNCNITVSSSAANNSPQAVSVNYQVSPTPVSSQCGFTNTSFRYLKFDNIYPVSWAAWKELEFYDKAGNKLKPTIIGGSADWIYPSQGAYGKPAAIDGDIYTQWNGADVGWVTPFSAPVNIILDFGKTVTLGRMRFLPQNTINRNVNIWVGDSSSYINTLFKSFQGNYFEAVWVDFNCITGTSIMSLSPASLSFSAKMGDLPPVGQTLTLQNTGAISLDWSASTDQSWCHVGPPSGNLAPGNSTSLTVTVDAPSNVGTFNCNVTVSSTVSPSQSTTVSYTVNAATPATISLSPTSFNFSGISGGSAPTGQTLTVRNTGTGNLTWYATLNQAWCHISPSSGMVSPGSSAVATVTVDAPTNVGSFGCSVAVSGPNTTNGPQNSGLTYNVTVPLSATMVLSNTAFVFSAVVNGTAPSGQSLTIRNSGAAVLNWTATANQTWCRVSPASGSLLPGATANATVSVDAPFGGGAYNCGINVSAPNTTNSPQAVSATYNITSSPTAIVSLSPLTFQFLASAGGGTPSSQILSVRNVGNASLRWNSAINQSWCHISPSSGTVAQGGSASVNVSVDRPSNVGTFGCSITIFETGNPADSQQAAVTYKVDSSVVVNPSQVIAASVSCGSVTVSWQQGRNATSYNLYRNTINSMPGTVYAADVSATSYEDTNVNLSTKYFYWVASVGATGGATPADVNSFQGVSPSPCEADLTPSDKNLNAINGVAQPHNGCDYNQFQGAPQDKTLKNGDILTFGINVCNIKGTADATLITLKDKLLNLSSPPNGFNAMVDGYPLTFVNRTPLVGEYSYDAVNFELDFNLGTVAKGLAKQITYDAQVKTQLNNATGCVKCQSQTVITFKKDTTSPFQTIDLYTPPIFYSVSK